MSLYCVQMNHFFLFCDADHWQNFSVACPCASLVNFLGHLMIAASFSNCRSLSSIAKGCKNLTDLILNDCQLLTGRSLEYVARSCKKLAQVKINGCQSMDTAALEYIGRWCP
jgi:hypothetical protein